MSFSYWNEAGSQKKHIQCDVCIVGAGIAGLSMAYWLNQQQPELKVLVVDKGLPGSGATGRNAGFITCGSVEHFNRMVGKHGESKALEIWRYSEENLNLLKQEIVANKASQMKFQQNGAFSLAASKNEWDELKEVAEIMKRNKIPVEVIDEKAVASRLGAQGFVGGIKYLDDAQVHPLLLVEELKNRIDAQLISHQEVFNIEKRGGDRIVLTPDYQIQSTLVVLCTNGYSSAIDSYFDDKIFPTRGQIMVLEPVKKFMEGPCYANFYLDYFRQLEDGSLLIGGFRQLEKDTEVGFSDHTTEAIQSALHDFVVKHLPQFEKARVTHRWAGVMGFSVDGEPMIGALPSDDQTFFLGGFTGHGLGLAFHGAKSLVDMIMGNPVPDWISAKRF